ncbi:GPP34 family phosphoprotein [Streptomyces sp. NPDC002564]|uniref:GOLPH3/VPS74 family protein n=1 Tax=Streptomyces sp. NPDC002564 TaxID=3364649 RepID=UPI003676E872
MTTARDLAIVAHDLSSERSVEQGDLSLVLAGAEVLDLAGAAALSLDGDRLSPHPRASTGDPLLDAAAAALVRHQPYESVEDWLWRRGRGLSAAYVDDLERAGLTAPSRGRRIRRWTGRGERPVDPAVRRGAEERWAAGEPVLVALAFAAGLRDEPGEEVPELVAEPVAAVLAAVGDAVQELRAVRQRKLIEDAAFDNVWRGF